MTLNLTTTELKEILADTDLTVNEFLHRLNKIKVDNYESKKA